MGRIRSLVLFLAVGIICSAQAKLSTVQVNSEGSLVVVPESKILTESSINPNVVAAQYAVRGEVLATAMHLQKELAAGAKYPFDRVIMCNIGNPQSLGQTPISFHRSVMSMAMNPSLVDFHKEAVASGSESPFAEDAVARALSYIEAVPAIGAYTNSQGIHLIREEVAAFIEGRDGYPVDPDELFLTDGASAGVKFGFQVLLRGKGYNDGVLAPIPQYPLYSALSTLMGAELVGYNLSEENGWALTLKALRKSLKAARRRGVNVRGLVVINPGNPTGAIMDVENMKDVVRFCIKEGLLLMADEVYQENIYTDNAKFVSFYKVAMDMEQEDPEGADKVQMVSFHSTSKGFLGECGTRGGYMHLTNIDPSVKAQIYKLASISLCSNVPGQLMVGLMVNPPTPDSVSGTKYEEEKNAILASLKRRAQMLGKALNSIEGMETQPLTGSMYAFPQIQLPPAAVAAAKEAGKLPDAFYCLKLLNETGIVVVPGSGFGQVDGTWHFRTTILPPESAMEEVVSRLTAFQAKFLAEYSE